MTNGVPDLVIVMAAAHRAWALRFAPWLLAPHSSENS